MSKRKCPLCNQPVSDQLFEKITGIWREREKQERELLERKKEFLKQQKESRSFPALVFDKKMASPG